MKKVKNLIKLIAEDRDISVEKLYSNSRKREVVLTRWICFRVLRELGLNLVTIASMFNKTHASVIYGLENLCYYSKEDNLAAKYWLSPEDLKKRMEEKEKEEFEVKFKNEIVPLLKEVCQYSIPPHLKTQIKSLWS